MAGFFDGPHATPKPSDDGPIYLGIKNMTEDGRLELNDVRHISWDEFPRWVRRVEPMPGDLVFTYEASLHRYAMIPRHFKGCLGRRTALIRPDTTKVNSRFLLYQLLGPQWRAEVTRRINVGSTVDRIPLIEFPRFPIRLPPLPIQRKIAAVLAAYDELIENNLRRSEILEEMVQTVYREWFINFRFPGHEDVALVDSRLGPIPEGWTCGKYGDIALEVKDGVDPTGIDPDMPYVGLEHLPQKSFTLTEHGTAADVTSRKWRFRRGDVLFGKLRPYFHKVVEAGFDGVSSTDAIVIRAEGGFRELALQVAFSTEFVGHAVSTSGGTDRPRAKWSDLASFDMVVPVAETIAGFTDSVRPMVDLAGVLARQNANIRGTRDLLLPKLVSGEIDVSGLDIDTEWLAS